MRLRIAVVFRARLPLGVGLVGSLPLSPAVASGSTRGDACRAVRRFTTSSTDHAAQYCRGCGTIFTSALTPRSRLSRRLFPGKPTGELCPRCRQLENENIYAARDGVRDVPPHAFQDTLRPLLQLREAVCLQIVDATDFDATCISELLESTITELGLPLLRTILVVNKKDLVPRLDEYDLLFLRDRASHGGIHCMAAHAVSAVTREGVSELAAAVVDAAAGHRNVVVCGAASVGKSTLINVLAKDVATIAARSLPARTPFEDAVAKMRDSGQISTGLRGLGLDGGRSEREDLMRELKLTVSHLPGTTLENLAVKCFASWSHSMYDTPGVIVPHSLAYSLFPAHVMAPLMQPSRQTPSAPLAIRHGESLLLEAAWMSPLAPMHPHGSHSLPDEAAASGDTLVLARLDVSCCSDVADIGDAQAISGDGDALEVAAVQLASPSVRARVVPTSRAPTACRVPPSHVLSLKEAFLQAENAEDAEALDECTLQRPLCSTPQAIEPPYHTSSRSRSVEVSFANIGCVSFVEPHGRPFRLRVHHVQGSKAWHRPPLYEHHCRVNGSEDGPVTPPGDRFYDVAQLRQRLATADATLADRVLDAEARVSSAPKPAPVHPVVPGSELAELQTAIESGTFTDEQRARFRELVFGERGV